LPPGGGLGNAARARRGLSDAIAAQHSSNADVTVFS